MEITEFTFYLKDGDGRPLRAVVVDQVEEAQPSESAQAFIVVDAFGVTYGFPRESIAYYTRRDYDVTQESPADSITTVEEVSG